MRCEEIMKRDVRCAQEHESVMDTAQTMRDENIGFVPVCDESNRVLGTITDRDICIRVAAEGKHPAECLVSEAMTREVVACRPDDDIGEAERLMGEKRKSRILVTDEQGFLQGVISLSDIAERDSLRRVAATLREVVAREARI